MLTQAKALVAGNHPETPGEITPSKFVIISVPVVPGADYDILARCILPARGARKGEGEKGGSSGQA
jgi:hypothetical protein